MGCFDIFMVVPGLTRAVPKLHIADATFQHEVPAEGHFYLGRSASSAPTRRA